MQLTIAESSIFSQLMPNSFKLAGLTNRQTRNEEVRVAKGCEMIIACCPARESAALPLPFGQVLSNYRGDCYTRIITMIAMKGPPVSTSTNNSESEVTILARILGNQHGQLPLQLSRYILKTGFTEEDKARMHDLVSRNQDDDLSSEEKEELSAYATAGTLLSILKSKARPALHAKHTKRTIA